MFLRLNGIPATEKPSSDEIYFIADGQGAWKASAGDLAKDIEGLCVILHDELAVYLFGTLQDYYSRLFFIPDFLQTAGLNAESPMSRGAFENALIRYREMPDLFRLLYLYDARCLVAGVQECTKEASFFLGEFYRSLNLDQLFAGSIQEPDGIRWVSSPVTTKIIGLLSMLFVRLHSLLDYVTRLAYEIENVPQSFDAYPKLASNNRTFGDRKRLRIQVTGTLFELHDEIREIELYRNRIIHQGFLDDLPKVYKNVRNGQDIERFILFPDRSSDGWFEKHGNRSLFFSGEDKINLRLPKLLEAFQTRQVETLRRIIHTLNEKRLQKTQ